MKVRTLLIIAVIMALGNNVRCQDDTIKHKAPVYWTFELGKSYLTNTSVVKNHSGHFGQTSSGSIYVYWNFPLTNTRSAPLSGFSIAPGIGLGAGTYSINKELSEENGHIYLDNIDGSYDYLYIQGIYLDVPVEFRYLTLPTPRNRNFSFEVGCKFGKLLYDEKKVQSRDSDDNEIMAITRKNPGIMNSIRYGLGTRIGYRIIRITSDHSIMGMSLALAGNYYLSDVFISQSDISSKSFYVGACAGFIFR